MRRHRLLFPLAALLAALGLLAAACGGSSSGSSSKKVSADDVANVGGTAIPRTKLDALMVRAQKSYKLQKRTFPKAGTSDYSLLQQQFVQSLVQETELQQKADQLGVKVTDKQVDARIKQYKDQSLGGSQPKYLQQLKTYGLSQSDARDLFRNQLLSDAVYQKVTKNVKVSDAQVRAYYKAHPEQYTQPESRQVRHILVKNKALADKIYAQLKADGEKNFATLAKKYSIDPGSKAQGGQLTILRGQTVPQFDKTAFALKTGELSKPVQTQYGWHVIQAVGAVKPKQATPFAQVKESIRQQLLQQQRSQEITKWVDGVKKEYAKKISYAAGFAPPATAATTSVGSTAGSAPTTTQATTTSK